MGAGTYLHLLPVSISIALPATFLVTYLWSVSSRHVHPILPGISDSGSLPPESCLFSFLLNISSALIGFAVYIRYKEVREYVNARGGVLGKVGPKARRLNFWATIFGFLSCSGLDIAANFQQANMNYVHYIGVELCFWCAALYVILQTIISYWMIPEINSMSMLVLRIILSISVTVSAIVNTITDNIAFNEFSGNSTVIQQWTPDDKGWPMHVTSTITEWLVILSLAAFILSYYQDFHRLIFNPPVLETKSVPKPERAQIKKFRSLPSVIETKKTDIEQT